MCALAAVIFLGALMNDATAQSPSLFSSPAATEAVNRTVVDQSRARSAPAASGTKPVATAAKGKQLETKRIRQEEEEEEEEVEEVVKSSKGEKNGDTDEKGAENEKTKLGREKKYITFII